MPTELLGELTGAQAVIVALVVALSLFAVQLYRAHQSGKPLNARLVVSEAPWDEIKDAFQDVREAKFTVPRSGPAIVLDPVDEFEFEQFMIENHFAPWNKLAYVYEDEDLNMRRLMRLTREDGEKRYFQLHVRVFFDEYETRIKPHVELCPVEHPNEHLDEVDFDHEEALDIMRELLETEGYEVLEVDH